MMNWQVSLLESPAFLLIAVSQVQQDRVTLPAGCGVWRCLGSSSSLPWLFLQAVCDSDQDGAFLFHLDVFRYLEALYLSILLMST